ncbi:MAG: 30S ribosomal protein S17 [Phycisphaerae bacterium]|nr:30S ribosomal protein S17 [Phycisphaerae bacterium]NIW94003.1 30S ribosomal protein S17 [Phycisphaerae bacterium]NIW99622.1 30S ribosomal protein S17 [Phycisphaerae bacterium]NIX29393.1 30S ribosomal protein S17 [Phycisphaerae bacterium]
MVREQRKELVGRVLSNKMDKTIVVSVQRIKKHRLYGKYIRVHKKYKAHDEQNLAAIGDTVRILESRPISKEKRWVMTEIIEKAQ